MKLVYKILSAMIFVVMALLAINTFSFLYAVKDVQRKRVETSELLFAQSLADHFPRAVIESNVSEITRILFAEKKLRENKVEYILVFNKKGYLLAHTYLGVMPKLFLKLRNDFDFEEKYRIEKIQKKNIFVYDVAVPVSEGINQVGTLHLGIKGDYVKGVIKSASRFLVIGSLIVIAISGMFAFFISVTIVRPIRNLNHALDRIGKGILGEKIKIKTSGEIGKLENSFNQMSENLRTARNDLERSKGKLKEFSKILQVKVKERTKELGLAYQNLKETQEELIQASKMVAIGQLSAGISHELNQPLTGIKGFAQVALMDLKDGDPLQEDLNKIIIQVNRMDDIIKNIRFFARKSDFKMTLLDVNEPIKSTIMLLRQQLEDHNIKIKLSLGKHLPKIQGDGNRLQQVFLNFITNARDAIKASEESSAGEIRIKTCLAKNKNNVEIFFEDSGKGISQEDIKNIFNPFFTTKSPDRGMGLGLSIVYRIVEEHKGKIRIESKQGMGTKFKVSLPIGNA